MKTKRIILIFVVAGFCLSILSVVVIKHYFSDRETINRRFGVELPDSFSIVEYYKDSGIITVAKIKCGNKEDVGNFINSLSDYKSINDSSIKYPDEIRYLDDKITWWNVDKDHLKGAYEKEFTKNDRTDTLGWMRIYVTNDNYVYMFWFY